MQHRLLQDVLDIADRLDLTDSEAAVVIGVSPHTYRIMRLARQLPTRRRARIAVEQFVETNGDARKREDLRLSPRAGVPVRRAK